MVKFNPTVSVMLIRVLFVFEQLWEGFAERRSCAERTRTGCYQSQVQQSRRNYDGREMMTRYLCSLVPGVYNVL